MAVRPPCEIVQRDFLPVVRTLVARGLKNAGFSQTEIALKMDLTQAAVSKYLNTKLSETRMSNECESLALRLTEMIKTGEVESDRIVHEVCSVCMRSRIGSTLCEMHKDKVHSLHVANCQICSQLLGGQDEALSERASVIGDILEALKIIEDSDSFEVIVPQVRANFVVCNDFAETYKEVVGVPGRITIVDGRVRALVSPQFGASQHTALLLLQAKQTWLGVRACLCVSGRENVVKSAGKSGFKILFMEDPESDASKIAKSLSRTNHLPGPKTAFPAIHIPGGYGIEPILYLFGPSAVELAQRSIRLSDVLTP
jgi:predicted fused transcriptional regulator/phosphomethylpyrimidine kinase/predicted transcriptional regulator